jgi:hypothetical protein
MKFVISSSVYRPAFSMLAGTTDSTGTTGGQASLIISDIGTTLIMVAGMGRFWITEAAL